MMGSLHPGEWSRWKSPIWFMKAWLWDVFDENLTYELKVNGRDKHSQRVCVVLESQDLLEVAAKEFGLPCLDNLQVCNHSIIFDRCILY